MPNQQEAPSLLLGFQPTSSFSLRSLRALRETVFFVLCGVIRGSGLIFLNVYDEIPRKHTKTVSETCLKTPHLYAFCITNRASAATNDVCMATNRHKLKVFSKIVKNDENRT